MERSPLLGLVRAAFPPQEATMGRRHVDPGSTAGNQTPIGKPEDRRRPDSLTPAPINFKTNTRLPMKKILPIVAFTLLAGTTTFAQQPSRMASSEALMTTLPGDGVTVTDYYKQNVYDPSESKIGEISDVVVDKEGRVAAFIISVGGFLGINEKDVAAPFNAVRATQKDGKWYLVMNTTKDALKNAPGYKYDKNSTKWVSDKS
jgi:sporulation protein YlmC with PRC-barrel domain